MLWLRHADKIVKKEIGKKVLRLCFFCIKKRMSTYLSTRCKGLIKTIYNKLSYDNLKKF